MVINHLLSIFLINYFHFLNGLLIFMILKIVKIYLIINFYKKRILEMFIIHFHNLHKTLHN